MFFWEILLVKNSKGSNALPSDASANISPFKEFPLWGLGRGGAIISWDEDGMLLVLNSRSRNPKRGGDHMSNALACEDEELMV